ncbi:MAG: hypothetical protein WA840_01805, partial [Caulobacteraceae bacterium]
MTGAGTSRDKAATWRGGVPGVLRAPPFGRLRPSVSETFAGKPHGWIGQALLDTPFLSGDEERRVRSVMDAIVHARIGGDFWGRRPCGRTPGETMVLRPKTFAGASSMIRTALAAGEAATVIASMPDRPWSRRFGAVLERKGMRVSLGLIEPWGLLERARRVAVEGDDAMAFLALALGKPVDCITACDLSGWGLTQDAPSLSQHGQRSFLQAAHAVLISGVVYRNPFTGRAASCEEIVETLADWRRTLDRNRRIACCAGMSMWKRGAVAAMLHTGEHAPPFHRRARAAVETAARRTGGVAVWTSRAPNGLAAASAWRDVPLFQVEDGFLRSVGLGSNLTPPCSIVVDARAPHYASGQVSDLEVLLAEGEFDAALLARAERLIASIVEAGLTKYNTGGLPLDLPRDRRLVLTPGQVGDDLSVRLSGAGLYDNLELLARTRAAEPDAVILFKPHPDVEAGHRPGAIPDAQALRYADRIVRGYSMAHLLGTVDAVHTLTSLTGFEALLRGREVIVHGQPFYAGWGLTRDLAPLARRTRRLSLAELVAGALILYPHYLDPRSGLPCPPEVLVARLAAAG